ncbi:MAG: N-6 DNA methylase [Chitinophagales bacterium]|nr:N-6 DNA methylase [Chitinophagales bacterium]
MSRQLIQQYYTKLDKIIQYGGIRNETAIRGAFHDLLNHYAEKRNLLVVEECPVQGTKGKNVIPDGVLKNAFRLDLGIWESKDEADTLNDEIDKKHKRGYPFYNALFEDSRTAVLFQYGEKVREANIREPDELDKLLDTFLNYRNEYIADFEKALEQFRHDIPTIVETLREKIDTASKLNKNFLAAQTSFLELCKAEINPDITLADIREMMIQHILTSDIFNKVFDDPGFHSHNTIAAELEKLTGILFSYSEKKNLLMSIEHYYDAINSAAASITDHHEKQKFLKSLYENFYKVYNPKAADRLGVVYTPNEIVKFMIESTDYLLNRHFGKTLADKNVEILDPATGTGTFICDIIEHIPKQQLLYKYKNELHANEVAILPYYISNLNIEYTFKQKMGMYEEFTNLCFVDTLDNTAALAYAGKQHSMFGLSSENTNRIKRQNGKKISVIIGNPPYNANQKNENENNKNREYPDIDKRIKNTYIENSTAQKTKMYDMYARFYRWAMDRIDQNGVIAFISNRGFIDKRGYDGFRKAIQEDFEAAYIIDTKSDVNDNPKIAGTTHNVFGIRTGVAIMFLVKRVSKKATCTINYISLSDEARKEEKWQWFHDNRIENLPFERISPDKSNNWVNIAENNWDEMIPICSKEVKTGKSKQAIFDFYSLGVVTARDEWVYDFNETTLERKIRFLIDSYNKDVARHYGKIEKGKVKDVVDYSIKWTRAIKNDLIKGKRYKIDNEKIIDSNYRPFVKMKMYFSRELNEMQNRVREILPAGTGDNFFIALMGNDSPKPFIVFSADKIFDYNGLSPAANGTKCLPLYRYDFTGNRIENVTDWGLEQFREHYLNHDSNDLRINMIKNKQNQGSHENPINHGSDMIKNKDNQGDHGNPMNHGSDSITKESIFHYCYAVLHNPAYRKKYELNLKREFPRIPFYDDFWKWSAWGKQLMDLHINYETTTPYPLKEITSDTKAEQKKKVKELFAKVEEPQSLYAHKPKIKVKLKADKESGTIEIDELTILTGIPKEAWEYKLGNRTALEWILDQYKEKKTKDPTIAEKFNTYRFADYKEKVIELLKRVCTVSVETVKIIAKMSEP